MTASGVGAALPVYDLKFGRPVGLEDGPWTAIVSTIERLERAIAHADLSQVVGTSKDLVE